MSMSIEAFRQLPPEDQRAVLATRRQRVRQAIEEAAAAELYEASLVPTIPLKKSANLEPVPDRDATVRELFRRDTSIREVQTADGVIYRR